MAGWRRVSSSRSELDDLSDMRLHRNQRLTAGGLLTVLAALLLLIPKSEAARGLSGLGITPASWQAYV